MGNDNQGRHERETLARERAGSDASWADAVNRALDQRDTIELELRAARAIIMALVHKCGPIDLHPQEILDTDRLTLHVVTGPNGFSYRTKLR